LNPSNKSYHYGRVFGLAPSRRHQVERGKQMNHADRIKAAFKRQAGRFNNPRLTLAREEYLRWMTSALDPKPDWTVLDVAAGTGHLGRTLAPLVREVVALDATPAMLEKGREAAREAGLANISFREGAAEASHFRKIRSIW
jgi:ubiquinone/menaquinone biosynthesis C-methylase UbiE